MTKQVFKPSVEEDLNRPHKVTLTEGQISTILYILEGYINPTNDNSYDPDCREDIDKNSVDEVSYNGQRLDAKYSPNSINSHF